MKSKDINVISNLVSIIVPNYNSEEFIQEFIDSVKSQTYPDWELIIVDDNSTDSSLEIIRRNISLDSRIKLLQREDENKGACQRRNQGFLASKGEYICFVDSDDLLPKDTLQIRVDEIKSDPHCDFVVVPAVSFNKVPFDIHKLVLGLPLFKDDLSMFLNRFRLPFGVWTNLYRREFLARTGILWDEELKSLQDSDFNIRSIAAGANYKYCDNDRPGYYWRVGGNPNSITKNIKNKKGFDSQLYFYSKLKEIFGEGKYKKDVERFGLTLLNRAALCQVEDDPEILFTIPGRKSKFHIMRWLYKNSFLRRISPLVNLLFSPIAMMSEYCFLIKNRRICKSYILKHAVQHR